MRRFFSEICCRNGAGNMQRLTLMRFVFWLRNGFQFSFSSAVSITRCGRSFYQSSRLYLFITSMMYEFEASLFFFMLFSLVSKTHFPLIFLLSYWYGATVVLLPRLFRQRHDSSMKTLRSTPHWSQLASNKQFMCEKIPRSSLCQSYCMVASLLSVFNDSKCLITNETSHKKGFNKFFNKSKLFSNQSKLFPLSMTYKNNWI